MTETTKKKTGRAKKTKTSRMNVIFILDESGSMDRVASDVRGGFNTYVRKLQGDGNTYSMTAIKFGTNVRPLFENLPLEEVPELTIENYTPSDTTALYDAIGYALNKLKDYPKDERFLVMIWTDGFENASKEFTKEMIVSLIKEKEAEGNWTFIYNGADQDAWAIANHLGFAPGNVQSFGSGATYTVMDNLAATTSTTATSGANQTRTFFTEQ